MNNNIDAVDYAVLKCLDKNGGCWKKKVYEWMDVHNDELPFLAEKSLQTIGRRIDQLHDAGEVESCILSPDAVNRDMIIGYKLTEKGQKTLATERNHMLRQIIKKAATTLLTPENQADLDIHRDAFIGLMCDELRIDDETRHNVIEQCETRELISLLAIHFFRANVDNTIEPDSSAKIAGLLERVPALKKSFTSETVVEQIRANLATKGTTIDGQVWKLVQET